MTCPCRHDGAERPFRTHRPGLFHVPAGAPRASVSFGAALHLKVVFRTTEICGMSDTSLPPRQLKAEPRSEIVRGAARQRIGSDVEADDGESG